MRLIATLFLFISIGVLHAQTAPPNGMLYQAIARDAAGNLAVRRTIHVQTTVRRTSATGTVMYSDEHKVNSNADAMFTVIVGQGKFLSGAYSKLTDIPWGNDKYFFNLKICVAPTLPGTGWKPSYTDMGTTQFWSVPYAMFSGKSADSLSLTIKGTGRQIKLGNYRPIFFSVADNDSLATNEIQTLSRAGGRLMLSLNGGMVTLPDSSATNELQTITRNGGRISLSLNGGTITLPDSSATNELQTISKTGSTVTLSQGGGSFTDDDKQTLSVSGTGSTKTLSISNGNNVQINVNDGDTSTNNEIQTLSRAGGRLNLNLGGGTVDLPDSTATNELQTLSRTGGRISLSQNGGTVTLPDSSPWNEIQRLTITNSKGTIILNNGGGTINLADSSATNELQKITLKGGRILLNQNGGEVALPDSSATNEIQSLSISSGKGRITLSNGGSVELNDSSSTNELQTLSQSGDTIKLSNGGGTAIFTDNDNQQLSLSNDTLFISNANYVKLGSLSGTSGSVSKNNRIGFNSSTTWTCPVGVTSIIVELWGGGGGGGGGSNAYSSCGLTWGNSCGSGSCTNIPYCGSNGGSGGKGGYSRATISVVSGTIYNITVGNGGQGGTGATMLTGIGDNGVDGESSSFSTLLSANGGKGGTGAVSTRGIPGWGASNSTPGVNGNDGNINNYSLSNLVYSSIIDGNRSYIPNGYIGGLINANCCSKGGNGGAGARTPATINGTPGDNGESGFCVIHY